MMSKIFFPSSHTLGLLHNWCSYLSVQGTCEALYNLIERLETGLLLQGRTLNHWSEMEW